MANTAFDHASALTLPGSTTNNGLVRWGDTSGTSFGNITGITSDGSNLTLLTRGEIRFSDADSTHFIALESPATVGTSYTMTLPSDLPAADEVLTVTSYSGGAGVLEWAAAGGGTTVAGTTDNGILTFVNSGSTFAAEADLTFDGSTLLFSGSGENTIKVTTSTGTAPANIQIVGAQGGTGNGGANLILGEGDLDGTAGDRAYRFSYLSNSDYFRFGSVQSGDIFRVADGETKVDFQGEVRIKSTNKLHFGDGTDTYFYQRADDQLALYVGGRHLFQVRGGGVFFGFHDGTNTGTFASGPALPDNPSNALANGVHIHDGDVNDYGAALSFSNSSVAHGITGQYDTSVYGDFKRRSGGGTGGGMDVRGVTDSGSNCLALRLHGTVGTSIQTGTTAGAYGAVGVLARKKSGTGTQACASNENIFSVDNNTNTRFIIKGNGDMYGDTSFSGIGDSYDDAQLIRALDIVKDGYGVKGYIQDKWDNFIQYNEQSLIDAGILGDTIANRGLLSYTGLQKFHSGAIWQLYSKLQDQDEEIRSLKEQMVALQAGD